MRRKNLWLRVSSCTMAALLATTSVAPVSAADFTSEIVMEDQQDEAADVEAAVIEEDAQADASAEVVADTAEADFADTEEAFTDTYEADDFADTTEALSDGADETTQTGFGTANTELAKGTYSVPASLKNASDTSQDSMAASCIAGAATLKVAEDGTARVTVPLQNVSVGETTSASKDWKIYKGDTTTETTDAEYTTDEEGNVNSITFTIPDKTTDGVYVNITIAAMNRAQDAFLMLDYAKAEAVAVAVDTTELEASIAKAEALEENSYTKATWDENKDAIAEALTAAKTALEAKESQETVDAANTALTDAMGKLVEAGDPTELKAKIEEAKALDENDYTTKSVNNWWSKLQTAITDAETAIEGRESQTKLDSCLRNINSYEGYLVKAYDTTELQKLIDKAEALKEEDYTAESWKEANLEDAIITAKTAIAARESKDGIHTATEALNNAMDKLVATSVVVGRGDFAKKLTPGTYSLPIELLNAGHIASTNEYTSPDYMSHTSMAVGCFTGEATLVIHEDGTATLTTGVQAITYTGMTGAASDWTIYENTQDFLDGKANSSTGARFNAHVDKTAVMGGKKKPSQISFTIPDLKQNVVATRMYIEVMSVNQDACIGLNWTKVKKVSDDTTPTSTVEKTYVAADSQTQLKQLSEGSTMKLSEDVTLTEDISIKGGTIDLNGHVLNQADNLIMIKGNVTIIDSSADKTGKITREKYSESSKSATSISVQKGSLTADGVTIDGQIGNRVYEGDQMYLRNLPKVSVTLRNCTLQDTVSTDDNNNVLFGYMENGLELTVDNCTADTGIGCGNSNSAVVHITNTESAALDVTAGETVVTNVKTTGSARIGGYSAMTIQDDEFTAGLTIGGSADVVLENVTVTKKASMSQALEVGSTGTVTIKSGVYANERARSYAVKVTKAPIQIEGGYFKGKVGSVNGAYRTPAGKVLGDITEGEYAGYQTVVDGTDPEVANPVATIYNADGTVAKQISEDDAALLLTYAAEGQTVKLNADVTVDSISFYRNCTLDLNGHVLTESEGINGENGACHVIDSSADKTGKIIGEYYIFNGNKAGTVLTLDGVSCEAMYVQGMSTGSLYVVNGTHFDGVISLNTVMGGGLTYVRDSSWTIRETDLDDNAITNPREVMESNVRTSQYTLTQTGDRSFTVTVNDLGKAMRAFEAIDASQYTKASYAAAKAVYDEIDGSADEDIQGDVIAQKAKELNDAVAALQTAATASDVKALKDAVTAAKKLSSADYTAASFKTLTTAITAAEKVLAAEEPSATDVATASKTLADAKAKLVKMAAQSITGVGSTYTKRYGNVAFVLKAKAKTAVSYKSNNTKVAVVDKNGKVTIKGAGTAKITITAAGTATYKAATRVVTIKVNKANPTIKTKVGTKNIKYTSLKKKAQVFTLGTTVNSKGKLTYKKLTKSSVIGVASNGRITVKKGAKKGTYRVKIRISSAARGNYNAGSRTVTVTVKVK